MPDFMAGLMGYGAADIVGVGFCRHRPTGSAKRAYSGVGVAMQGTLNGAYS